MIDTHVHIWGPEIADLEWLPGSQFPATVTVDDLAPTSPVVLVTADSAGDQMLREARALSDLSATREEVWGFVGAVNLRTDLDDLDKQLDALTALPGLVGVRDNLQDTLADRDPGQLIDGWRALAERDIGFDACVRAHELRQLTSLLAQVPELRVVLDHMGKPPVQDDLRMCVWADDLARLAERPNTSCKLSGLPAECRDGHATDDIARPIIARALAEFGSERCMVGSDQPISTDPRWCARVLEWVAESDRDQVAHDTAAHHYRSLA